MGKRDPLRVLDPIPVRNMHELVLTQLEEKILEGTLKEGDKLPSEEELARQAGVGRRTMREALKVLDMKGLIEVRKGQGAFVVRKDLDNYIESLNTNIRAYLANNPARLEDVLEFRELIEGGAVKELAGDHTQKVLDKLDGYLDAQRSGLKAQDPDTYNRAHFKFHHVIVNGMKNAIIAMLYEQVLNLIVVRMSESGSDPRVEIVAIKEHEAILKAISEGDGEKAAGAVKKHLSTSFANLKKLLAEQP